MKDHAIEAIRAVRQQISEEYGHDIKAFLDHYRELESQYKERLIEGKQVQGVLPRAQVAKRAEERLASQGTPP